jgi:hypothetical protein
MSTRTMTHFLDWPESRGSNYHKSLHSRGITPFGVYVVQFPGRVKVGKSGHVRTRISQHRQNGATRAVGFGAHGNSAIEWFALRELDRIADRIGTSESFTGITFEEAEKVLATVARDQLGDWPEIIYTWRETS